MINSMNDKARETLARNLRKVMDGSADLRSQAALAKKSGVGQTTIGYMLKADSRVGAPRVDNVEKVANAFGLEAWQLLHPTMGDRILTARELDLYRQFREALAKLDK